MSGTTQILFNSPALHSLKRDQLVKLCKIHSVKATGKNAELIEKLKQRAQGMPLDFSQIIPSADEEASDVGMDGEEYLVRTQLPRPSEQWEIVMDDIEEVEESVGTVSSKGSLRTVNGARGEFGTGNTKSSSVSSSIKALATSLGIKRSAPFRSAPAADDLTVRSIPYSALPPPDVPPHTDHFTLSTAAMTPDKSAADADGDISMSAPVPGSPTRPGAPAPANARLSFSKGLTTTIRLITTSREHAPSPPPLAPYQTDFDLDMGSPSAAPGSSQHISVWPASPGPGHERLYPDLPLDDLLPKSLQLSKDSDIQMTQEDDDMGMPGGLTPSALQRTPAKLARSPHKAAHLADVPDLFSPASNSRPKPKAVASPGLPRSTPFLFGSPLPQKNTSNKEFGQAAASVLEEMNRRLADSGANKVDSAVLEKKIPDAFNFLNMASGSVKSETTDRFAKVHEEAFSKMDSIATHYAARRGMQPPANAPVSKKRKSDALGMGPHPGTQRKASAASTRVISNGVRKKMGIPGAFVEDDAEDEEDPGDRRSSKRLRVVGGEDVHRGKRVSLAPARGDGGKGDDTDKDERRKSKEREAIRKKLDASKARRRSSRGMPSAGRPSIGKAPLTSKAKASRFGFLNSAKSLVRNVWNMGGTTSTAKPATAATSGIPVAKAPSVPATKPIPEPKLAAAPSIKKTSTVGSSTNKTASHSRTPSNSSTLNTLAKLNVPTMVPGGDSSTASSKSSNGQLRHPIPSFAPPQSQSSGHIMRSSSTANSRMSTKTRESTVVGMSSMGTRTSVASNAGSTVTSLGAKRSMPPAASGSAQSSRSDSSLSKNSTTQQKRTSTLLAPTASSLAKMSMPRSRSSNSAKASGAPVQEEQRSPVRKAEQASTPQPSSPRSPGTIFSKPLDGFGSSPARQEPFPNPSLTAAATTLMGNPSSSGNPSAIPPKPKVILSRKPRISRTKVMAKAVAQRADMSSVGSPTRVLSPRTRSSTGRKSLGVVKTGRSSNADVVKSAKLKKARQSEYIRRKSRVGGEGENVGGDDK